MGSRAEAQRLIEDGRVLVDGEPRAKRHALREGEEVEVHPRAAVPSDLEPEEVPFTVRYRDEDLLVVDKPAGVVTHPSRGHEGGTLVHGLLALAVAGPGEWSVDWAIDIVFTDFPVRRVAHHAAARTG